MLPLCREEGVGVLPWSPLARGWLARPPDEKRATARGGEDTYADRLYEDFPEADDVIARVGRVAENRGVSRARVALAWLLRQPGVTAPIVGATKPEHLDDAVAAVGLELTDEEAALLEEPYRPRPVRGHE